jgi:hypothetical protein
VPYVPRASLGPAVETTVGNNAAPDPCADLDKEQVVYGLAHPAPVLAERHHVYVVVDEDGGGVLAGECIPYGEPIPAGHDRGRPQQPRRLLDGSRNPHAYGPHFVPARVLLFE